MEGVRRSAPAILKRRNNANEKIEQRKERNDMAAPAALLAVKAAVAVAADKRGRYVLASIVAAVLVPFV